jgi:hypothetical protein
MNGAQVQSGELNVVNDAVNVVHDALNVVNGLCFVTNGARNEVPEAAKWKTMGKTR